MTVYFGPRWDAPRLDDAEQVETPAGQLCLRCEEEIAQGDRGIMTPIMYSVNKSGVEPIHAECDMLGVMGHMYGVCSCTGFDTNSRDAARELWQRVGKARGVPLDVVTEPTPQ